MKKMKNNNLKISQMNMATNESFIKENLKNPHFLELVRTWIADHEKHNGGLFGDDDLGSDSLELVFNENTSFYKFMRRKWNLSNTNPKKSISFGRYVMNKLDYNPSWNEMQCGVFMKRWLYKSLVVDTKRNEIRLTVSRDVLKIFHYNLLASNYVSLTAREIRALIDLNLTKNYDVISNMLFELKRKAPRGFVWYLGCLEYNLDAYRIKYKVKIPNSTSQEKHFMSLKKSFAKLNFEMLWIKRKNKITFYFTQKTEGVKVKGIKPTVDLIRNKDYLFTPKQEDLRKQIINLLYNYATHLQKIQNGDSKMETDSRIDKNRKIELTRIQLERVMKTFLTEAKYSKWKKEIK